MGSVFRHHHEDLTLEKLQSRFGDKPLKLQVVRPQNGTAVLKGLIARSIRENESTVNIYLTLG